MSRLGADACRTNRMIGSIEHVGDDGFIVQALSSEDPAFFGGKRLFTNFDDMLRFFADYLQVYKEPGALFGIKPEKSNTSATKEAGGNGSPVLLNQLSGMR